MNGIKRIVYDSVRSLKWGVLPTFVALFGTALTYASELSVDEATVSSRFTIMGVSTNMTGGISGSLSNGLVAYWPLNGNANDYSTNGFNGTIANTSHVVSVAGKFSTAYYFDGEWGEARINIPSGIGSAITTSATFNAWVKRESQVSESGHEAIVSIKSDENDNTHYPLGGTVYISILRGGSGNRLSFSSTVLDKTQWFMLTVVTSPGSANYRVYENGTLVYSGTGDSSLSLGSHMSLGEQSFTGAYGTHNYIGSIDEVAMWNRALATNDIATLYSMGLNTNIAVSALSSSLLVNTPTTIKELVPQGDISMGSFTNKP